MQSQLIDTISAMKTFLDGLPDQSSSPSLYVDLEGNNLSRNGTLSLLTMFVEPQKKVYLIDITTLGRDAFNTAGDNECTLRSILESREEKKVFFDIRNDSDALFSLYGVRVGGIEDLQLMELASRTFSRRTVNGLAKCIGQDTTLTYVDRQAWQKVKDKGRDLFDPGRGGSYAVFDQRPLSQEVMEYCVQDVTLMPHLREVYRSKLCDAWWRKIEEETAARIRLSQSASYNGKGRHMAEGPRGWLNWTPASGERFVRTLFEEDRTGLAPVPSNVSMVSSPSGRLTNVGIDNISGQLSGLRLQTGSDRRKSLVLDGSSDDEPGGGVWAERDKHLYEDEDDGPGDLTACD